jgi:hypothetical protein
LKNTEAAHISGYFTPRKKQGMDFDKKRVWATLWAIFSQAHLVALPTSWSANVVFETGAQLNNRRRLF